METLDEAKVYLKENFEIGVKCPCCGQFVKKYKRPMHTTMARSLIQLYQMSNLDTEKYFYSGDIVKGISSTGTNDLSKLKFWKLIEEAKADGTQKGRTSGFWRITEAGLKFVERKTVVDQGIYLYNDKFLGFYGEKIDIKGALGSKFDYEKLMKGE